MAEVRINLPDTTDAVIWAREFIKTISERPGIEFDEGTMIEWFANAIMAGYHKGRRKQREGIIIS